MSRESDLADLEELKAEMEFRKRQLPPEEIGGAPGGAFLGANVPLQTTPEKTFAPEKGKGLARRAAEWAAEKAPPMIAAYKAGTKGYAYGKETGIPLAGPVLGTAAATIAATGTETAVQEAKRDLGLGQHTDSFDESFAHGLSAGSDALVSEIGGRLTSPLESHIKPYKTDYTPEEVANLAVMKDKLRGVYEKITGSKFNEASTSWNPFRRGDSLNNQVDKSSMAQRLQAAGLNPDQARKVILGNGQSVGDLTDNRLYVGLQKLVGASSANLEYKGTRGKMMNMAIRDLGDRFGQSIPPEDLGDAIKAALNGKFDTLTTNRNLGMQALGMTLRPDFKFDGRKLKLGRMNATEGPWSLVSGLSDAPTFKETQQVREALGKMATDGSLQGPAGDQARSEAGAAAKWMDSRVGEQFTGQQKKYYNMWADADNEYNRGKFDDEFVKGLIHSPMASKAYANKILRDGDVGNFRKFEAAANGLKTETGQDLANQVKANIWERVARGATSADGQIMQPGRMQAQLLNDGRYGEKFLRATMGDGIVDDYTKLAGAMQTLNEKAKIKGLDRFGEGQGATKLGAAAIVGNLLGGGVHTDVAAKIATVLGAPAALAKVLNSERAIKLTTKLANAVEGGQPGRASRLAGYIIEASGLTPEELVLTSGAAPSAMQKMQGWRHQLSEGHLPWKATEAVGHGVKQVAKSLTQDIGGSSPGMYR